MVGRNAKPVVRINNFAVGVAGAIGDPCAIARQQNRLERGHHAAGRYDRFNRFSTVEDVHVRLAIRNDKQWFLLKLVAHADAQPLGSPQRGMGIAEPGFFFRCGTSGSWVTRW